MAEHLSVARNRTRSGHSAPLVNQSGTLGHMRHATVLFLLLASAGCVHQRVRSAGERAHDPFKWAADSGDPGTDAVNTAIEAGLAAAAANSHDPAVPFCTPETGEQTDP